MSSASRGGVRWFKVFVTVLKRTIIRRETNLGNANRARVLIYVGKFFFWGGMLFNIINYVYDYNSVPKKQSRNIDGRLTLRRVVYDNIVLAAI